MSAGRISFLSPDQHGSTCLFSLRPSLVPPLYILSTPFLNAHERWENTSSTVGPTLPIRLFSLPLSLVPPPYVLSAASLSAYERWENTAFVAEPTLPNPLVLFTDVAGAASVRLLHHPCPPTGRSWIHVAGSAGSPCSHRWPRCHILFPLLLCVPIDNGRILLPLLDHTLLEAPILLAAITGDPAVSSFQPCSNRIPGLGEHCFHCRTTAH